MQILEKSQKWTTGDNLIWFSCEKFFQTWYNLSAWYKISVCCNSF